MGYYKKHGVAATVYFVLTTPGTKSFDPTPVTFAAGDSKISRSDDYINSTNLPTHIGNGIYSLVITAAEMTDVSVVEMLLVDQSTPKLWEDCALEIEVFGGGVGSAAVWVTDYNRSYMGKSSVSAG